MEGNEISEIAKATQEVAKATKTGIEATEKFGGFLSRLIGEPLENAMGIFSDTIKFKRWERQMRLTDRANEFIEKRKIEELRKLPPKIAIPIVDKATLEENDELQDLWACLIASSVDPNFEGSLRTAFIDIITQLEVIDVHILHNVFNQIKQMMQKKSELVNVDITSIELPLFPVDSEDIKKALNIDEIALRESLDNLMRVRCLSQFKMRHSVNIPIDKNDVIGRLMRGASLRPSVSKDMQRIEFDLMHNYELICLTNLGASFTKACIPD